MSQGEISIINGALVQLGQDPVVAVDVDPAPSRLVKIRPHLQPAIDAVLVKYGWLCALEYVTLEPSGHVDGNWKYPVHYVLPEDCLRLWEVARVDGWERGVTKRNGSTQMVVRAKEGGPLSIAYVARREADTLDANVRDAVTFELAARACHPMTGNTELAQKLEAAANKALLAAMGTDGQDAKTDAMHVTDRVGDLRQQAG